jgi:hypothetical protein
MGLFHTFLGMKKSLFFPDDKGPFSNPNNGSLSFLIAHAINTSNRLAA